MHVIVPVQSGNKRTKRRRLLVAALIITVGFILLINNPLLNRIWPHIKNHDVPPVTGLHPIVAAKQMTLIQETKKIGITILITDGFRSTVEQDALYRQGRSDKGQIVTTVQGGDSYHNYGLAIDFALRTLKGKVVWDLKYDGNHNGKSDWMEVVAIAKRLGFTWGGDWKNFKDYPHLQMDFGYTIGELKRGERPTDVKS
ncbi:peptidoglycan L-alanyl-D-glutamate endopeptidase CwlK [Paenibacillus baekrokdamisoli]|uniref:Peptidoglycan L-alanyl-D-glutamate endopeptidase CwlK n=1 Tax=Paenibacillus baekrokdamisoli TaxID=1712516 RepID=A0A3G9IXY2_9BACL|nr:M15 family metallopeptidase [Paenibacillus baekrokdamisoli]MBB3072322.1 peptidoglycan L-alanyl-D-glutamate endopeptidase CwlK [Paenibacillus baekrokdamisoli]BBH23192.1 peptidoglycan L-alanyl-D-glutamate endopeptidase CwlK [Paenibacillus baekrokdamisoli]